MTNTAPRVQLERICLQGSTWAGPKVTKCNDKNKNFSTQDSHVVPQHGTDRAAQCLTSQIGRDAVLSLSYGRRYHTLLFDNQVGIVVIRTTTHRADQVPLWAGPKVDLWSKKKKGKKKEKEKVSVGKKRDERKRRECRVEQNKINDRKDVFFVQQQQIVHSEVK